MLKQYWKYKKRKAVSLAFIAGFVIGRSSNSGTIDYGFGQRGLGIYVYDEDWNIIEFQPEVPEIM